MRKSPILVACLAAAAACYPGRSVDSTTQFASVTTTFDDSADFASVTRYALPDTVMYIPRDDDEEVPSATQAAILGRIRADLNALGWQEVLDPRANPVDVYVSAVVSTTTMIFFDYFWWDYWYWYPYWPLSWGASTNWYYPPYWYAYSYTTGTVMMSMIDVRPGALSRAGPDAIPVIWTGAVNGVLADRNTNLEIVTAGIDQAFRQSPYLAGGPPQ